MVSVISELNKGNDITTISFIVDDHVVTKLESLYSDFTKGYPILHLAIPLTIVSFTSINLT